MPTLNAITLLVNALTLALALGFLLIILWQDSRRELNQFFTMFLFMVMLWNIGSLMVQVSELIVSDGVLVLLATNVLELGFTGSSVAVYIFTTVLVGVQTRRFQVLAFTSLLIVVGYRAFLIVNQGLVSPMNTLANTDILLNYQFTPFFLIFYLVFDGITLFLVWRYRRKVRSRGLTTGIVLFLVGQGLVFINPQLIVASFSTSISSIGALMVSFAIIQRQIILPLAERNSQIEVLHRVSLAVTSQMALDTVLKEIAEQAAGWLAADGVGIFLVRRTSEAEQDQDSVVRPVERLNLVTVYNLPELLTDLEVEIGRGVAGEVAARRKTIYLENYRRDWRGESEFGGIGNSFGSVICVPLVSANEIIGALMVIAGHQGRLFEDQDVYLLELLSAQAAVAISHSQSFAEQQKAKAEAEAANEQLIAVLTSTENPVIALDRSLKPIFTNPAAQHFLKIDKEQAIIHTLPSRLFPESPLQVMREIRQRGEYVYEVALNNKIFLCHIAPLRRDEAIRGLVAVLNDVTELKELDRLKSEMVRMASHDLKNPLMGAMSYIDLLRDDLNDAEIASMEMNETIETIEWQLERMHRIIGGILDLERLNTGLSGPMLCDPNVIIENAIAELQHFIDDRGVQVNIEVQDNLPMFVGDREKFERAVVNLLENAVKFTLTNGNVTLKAYAQDSNILFEVSDNGVGIPLEIQPRIFDRFFRGNQEGVEHVTGSGLGLSLVKTIIENHMGQIWFESKDNEGTTFFISVPAVTDSHAKDVRVIN